MICIELETDIGFDGTTVTAFADLTWTNAGDGRFRGVDTALAGIGIWDPREMIDGIERQFGPAVDRLSLNSGSLAHARDLLVERGVFVAPSIPDNAMTVGTHSPAGWGGAAGVRLRIAPQVLPTESGAQQFGGSGQVSTTTFLSGQAGALFLPNGMRMFAFGITIGTTILAHWVQPVADPRTIMDLAVAAQPPPQYV